MNASTKRYFCAILMIILTVPLSSYRFDAAVEGFLVEANKIHPRVLTDATGVFTVTLSELDYYVHMKMEPASLHGFALREDQYSEESKAVLLSLKNMKAISGIDYSGMIVRRFPIVERETNMVQIIYDVEKNLRAWVQTVDTKYVRTSVGQLVPAESMLFADGENLSYSFDIFFLLHGKKRTFYQRPDETAPSITLPDAESFDKIPWRERKEPVSSYEISQMQNGFAKVFTRSGADGELLFAGWVKMYLDGKLSVWQFETRGC